MTGVMFLSGDAEEAVKGLPGHTCQCKMAMRVQKKF